MIDRNRTLASTAAAIGILLHVSSGVGMAQSGNEYYVKLTCQALTTLPLNPIVFTPVLVMYFPADGNAPFPTLFELRDQHPEAFHYMNMVCNQERYAYTIPPPQPTPWPDWGNDRKYQKVEIAEAIIPSSQLNRQYGEPCTTNLSCQYGCDLNTHSCYGAPCGPFSCL